MSCPGCTEGSGLWLQQDVAPRSVAVSVLSSLVWNLGEWLVLPVLLESPRVMVGSGQAPGCDPLLWTLGPSCGRGFSGCQGRQSGQSWAVVLINQGVPLVGVCDQLCDFLSLEFS